MSQNWKQLGIIMLRTLLDDAKCAANTYTPDRLLDLLITAAYFVMVDIDFGTDFVIDLENKEITPDPLTSDDGQDFMALMVMRAACLADEGLFRNAALKSGVTARCGPAVLQVGGEHGRLLMELLKNGPCKTYEQLKKEYNFRYKGRNILHAVMSPFVSNEVDPSSL